MYRTRKPDEPELLDNDVFEGYCRDLAEKIAGIVNFKYSIKLVPDQKYGSKLDNGTWNGMVGELAKGVGGGWLGWVGVG